MADAQGIDLDTPFDDLEGRLRRVILHGAGDAWFKVPAAKDRPAFSFQYKGLFPAIEEAGRVSFYFRYKLHGMVDDVPCAACMGGRLRDDAAAVKFHGFTMDQVGQWPLGRAYEFFKSLKLTGDEKHIAGDLVREVRERLGFLVDVGLDYLSLSRGTPTLSGGESQRIRLASQIGSGLTGVLYVLDEPTIGLHPRDNARLLGALKRLRDLGNTLVLVEHDREVIEAADHLVDFGPGSGAGGGQVTAAGPPAKVKTSNASITGRYLSGKAAIPVPTNRRPVDADAPALVVRGARQHNLKNVDVNFPLGVVTVVTGVSGSGKSSLVQDILMNAASRHLHRANVTPGAHDAVEGFEHVDKVIGVDQSPLGSTPTSTPVTYSGAYDLIREVFAKLPEAKVRGYSPRRFSFNQPGGRCEACEGAGRKRIEMHFLPDVWVSCDACGGARFTAETLAVKFRGKTIADVLDMTVDEALALFTSVPKVRKVLQTLADVGLGYVPLGQPAPTLSGGEAQRVKLAAELARPDTGKTLYVLDEPTTGLHLDDTRKLLAVVHRLADLGNTVVIIEHNLEVIKTADWVIDMGPEAGQAGGEVVVAGTPEKVAATKRSLTGAILKGVLAAGPHAAREQFDPKAAAKKILEESKKAAAAEAGTAGSAKTPWEQDGRRWHCHDRLARNGRPARWDGQILARVVDRVIELGEDLFSTPDWSQRSIVKISAKAKGSPVFFTALTGHEWVLTLKFRVPRGAFPADKLQSQWKLPAFHEVSPPVLSDSPRVSVSSVSGGGYELTVTASADDLNIPAFDRFLTQAVAAFRKTVQGGGGKLVKASELM
ncbi:MAG: excinuclease ABC subunit UvrA [Isosphaeraceae bacterium]